MRAASLLRWMDASPLRTDPLPCVFASVCVCLAHLPPCLPACGPIIRAARAQLGEASMATSCGTLHLEERFGLTSLSAHLLSASMLCSKIVQLADLQGALE